MHVGRRAHQRRASLRGDADGAALFHLLEGLIGVQRTAGQQLLTLKELDGLKFFGRQNRVFEVALQSVELLQVNQLLGEIFLALELDAHIAPIA